MPNVDTAMRSPLSLVRFLLVAVVALLAATTEAAVGLIEIAGKDGGEAVTVYYPPVAKRRRSSEVPSPSTWPCRVPLCAGIGA